MEFLHGHIAITLGLVLATALLAGLAADFLRLPKVTAYLVVGILLGPSAAHVLAAREVQTLHPITQLAMALVLFNLGCQFPLTRARRIAGTVGRLALGDVGLTLLLVSGGLLLLGQPWTYALLLGALAIATAPATTVLVLKEAESEGPLTELAEALVVVNNFAAILAFEIVLAVVFVLVGRLETPVLTQFGLLAGKVLGSILVGVAAGGLVSFCCGLLAPGHWLVLLVAATTLLMGINETLGIPYMLSFLAMGVTVANTSGSTASIVAVLDRLTGFLCVIFFVVHGADLQLSALLAAGWIGVAYIVLRSSGKVLGIYLMAPLTAAPPVVRTGLGPAIVAQAGAAIALAEVAAERLPEVGREVQAVVLGTVVFFELVGPLLIRRAVLNAGEMPLYRAVRHSTNTPLSQAQGMWIRLQVAFGRDPVKRRNPDQVRVRELVRANVQTLNQSASFAEVTALIEHSRDNTYAVVDDEARLVGVLRYSEISHVLFDRAAGNLIRAADLASPAPRVLYPDQPATAALALFRAGHDDCIPVVSDGEQRFFKGMVQRRDVVGYLVRREQG